MSIATINSEYMESLTNHLCYEKFSMKLRYSKKKNIDNTVFVSDVTAI